MSSLIAFIAGVMTGAAGMIILAVIWDECDLNRAFGSMLRRNRRDGDSERPDRDPDTGLRVIRGFSETAGE